MRHPVGDLGGGEPTGDLEDPALGQHVRDTGLRERDLRPRLALLGLAGAYLSIAQTNAFGEDMTGGKGFIAMAVVILGKWTPLGITAGAALFGGANALQMSVQNLGVEIPNNIILMIPYIATVVAVVAVSRKRVGAPSAQGVPYIKS